MDSVEFWCVCFLLMILLPLLVHFFVIDLIFISRHAIGVHIGRFLARGKWRSLTSTASNFGFCYTTDVDIYWKHMNNVRITREMDFVLYGFLSTTGLMYDVQKNIAGDSVFWKVASNTRFRRPIQVFSTFDIKTKIVYWEKDSLYVEQQLITKDNFVRVVSVTKVGVKGLDLEKVFQNTELASPKPSEELQAWISSIQISSKRLRGLA